MISIYLDTSVINFLFADDAPEKKEITIDLFDNYIVNNIYKAFISQFVFQEIDQTSDIQKKHKLLSVINNYPIEPLLLNDLPEIDMLADLYIHNNIIPQKKKA